MPVLVRASLLALLAAASLPCAPVLAKTASATLQVSATVEASCVIRSVQNIAFGVYQSNSTKSKKASPDISGTGEFTVLCTSGVQPQVRLGQGDHPGSGSTDTLPVRQMAQGSAALKYQLYQDSSHSLIWGNTLASAETLPAQHGLVPQQVRVYALLPGAQDVPGGTYSDTVQITLEF